MAPGEYVQLAVTDNGSGMTPEVKSAHLRAVLHDEGAGQGHGPRLATCHGIVKQSGGYIAVYSEVGVGHDVQGVCCRAVNEEAEVVDAQRRDALRRKRHGHSAARGRRTDAPRTRPHRARGTRLRCALRREWPRRAARTRRTSREEDRPPLHRRGDAGDGRQGTRGKHPRRNIPTRMWSSAPATPKTRSSTMAASNRASSFCRSPTPSRASRRSSAKCSPLRLREAWTYWPASLARRADRGFSRSRRNRPWLSPGSPDRGAAF